MPALTIDRLFVYGTLQPGQPNEHELASLPGEWSKARIRGRLVDVGWGAYLGFPGLVIDVSGDWITGHVLSSSTLRREWARLDAFEGVGYERVIASITLESGEETEAHVYVVRPGAEETVT